MCYHGISSKEVANFLYKEGYINVFSLDGGYSAWRKYTLEQKRKR